MNDLIKQRLGISVKAKTITPAKTEASIIIDAVRAQVMTALTEGSLLNTMSGENTMSRITRKEAKEKFAQDMIAFFKRGNVIGSKQAREIYKKHYEAQCEQATVFRSAN